MSVLPKTNKYLTILGCSVILETQLTLAILIPSRTTDTFISLGMLMVLIYQGAPVIIQRSLDCRFSTLDGEGVPHCWIP